MCYQVNDRCGIRTLIYQTSTEARSVDVDERETKFSDEIVLFSTVLFAELSRGSRPGSQRLGKPVRFYCLQTSGIGVQTPAFSFWCRYAPKNELKIAMLFCNFSQVTK